MNLSCKKNKLQIFAVLSAIIKS